ncbi:hypothetical protein [Paenarthrobacter aurescens]|uniref:Uncharacterized protein n=1 Tax=Paenarthrobacter aurescens TaxID=43663 RepID=A0A4Y3NGU5_PAEAU|nr:hypothetical protein [Paenarthrobacter aurescens]MDO6143938.1 hypothetical protein [Paenarthrobacter aurescens]MDO6147785.1 hypothetical protein [Paenarthrobacter aurescens]MDO6159029.1 hypothetical protein [Paenarthrobacter aurescens]MDO6163013.1 hypothetical protein [Paenarthrobacter aurescens]GEB20423.1 hypothetical protein AAU01_31780 [Paenarthrobacter aurescens]
MDWLIWVIVIVLVVAIVWWLMNRNKARTTDATASRAPADDRVSGNTVTAAPAAMEPSNTASMPDPAATAAGVAGLAGVTNSGKSATEGSGPRFNEPDVADPDATEADVAHGASPAAAESPTAAEPPTAADVETEPRAAVDDSPAAPATDARPAATPGLGVAEPVIASPSVAEPVIDEPVVAEPVVDTDAKVHAADAGDAVHRDSGSAAATSTPDTGGVLAEDTAKADAAADKAEWESSWTDAGGTPVHHHEYTDPHSPTLPGAESAAAEDSAGSGHLAVEHPYGTGSSSAPGDAYPVKASAAAMTYHDEDTAGYEDAPADVWFESSAHAEAAGFRPPRRNRH